MVEWVGVSFRAKVFYVLLCFFFFSSAVSAGASALGVSSQGGEAYVKTWTQLLADATNEVLKRYSAIQMLNRFTKIDLVLQM